MRVPTDEQGRTASRSMPAAAARRLVELACLAPSVHNSQPWSWVLDGDRLDLFADTHRRLWVQDPRGRNQAISCGAALDHLLRAARALGWEADVRLLPHHDDPSLLAEVRLRPGPPSAAAAQEIALLHRRCTDRRRFTSWPVRDDLVQHLATVARSSGARAVPVVDRVARWRTEVLANRAHCVQQADLAVMTEQRRWVPRLGVDGMPSAVLPDGPDHDPLSRFAEGHHDASRAVRGGERVIVLGGDEDELAAWLRTGQGLSALWLRATELGLSLVPLTQPIEVTDVNAELQHRILDDRFVPHVVARVGWQQIGRSDLPRTRRRPVDQVFTVRGATRGRPAAATGS